MLLGIIDEATGTPDFDFSERLYRLPPNFMDIIQKGEPAANMQRVLLMLQRWYNFKDPFE
jgi:hypothetical protein